MKKENTRATVDFDPEFAFPVLLSMFAREQAEKIALIEGDNKRSYGEMVARINCMANGLIALGVAPGDRVAVLSRNSMAYSELFCAVLIAGATAVPLQSMITDDSLRLMLRDCAAKVLVVSAEFAPMVDKFLDDQQTIVAGGLIGFDFTDQNFTAFEPWLEQQSAIAPGIALNGTGEFNIIYSSGTTGVPKGIVHDHATRQGLAKGLMNTGIGAHSVTLISTPLYSNTTITTWWPTLCAGGTMVLMPKFDAQAALTLIEQWSVTHAMLVPVQYDRIMSLPNFSHFDLSSLQMTYSTSAPLRKSLKAQIIDHLPSELIEFYGLTEGGVGTLFIGSVAKEHGKLDSVGPPLPGAIVKIIDDKGLELGHRQIGEIVGRSKSMSNGYLNREQANEDMFWHDADGALFYRSGDVGYLDEDGWLYLSDRKKDMIISGGFNIYATDLELVLLDHPDVREAAVVALPSKAWGETPLAIVVMEPGREIAAPELCAWANRQLGKAQRISQLVVVDELPKSSIGKVLKRELRERYAGLGDD